MYYMLIKVTGHSKIKFFEGFPSSVQDFFYIDGKRWIGNIFPRFSSRLFGHVFFEPVFALSTQEHVSINSI